MKGDDYTIGRHFWTHFWCGLVIGGFLGAKICLGEFNSNWAFLISIIAIAVAFALAVAYWGDPLWRRILEWWGWWDL